MSAAILALFAAGPACLRPENGRGEVDGTFGVRVCRPSGDRPVGRYRFDAARLDTMRTGDALLIEIQQYAVDIEETDGLMIRIDNVHTVRADTTRPLVLPLSLSPADANCALSLFQTCPDAPQLFCAHGTVGFTSFTIAADPLDTGSGEVLAGTLTATVVGADHAVVAGSLHASFDFRPLPMPTNTPRP